MSNNKLPTYVIQPNPKHIKPDVNTPINMTKHPGKSGVIMHRNIYDPYLGTKYGHQICKIGRAHV